MSADEVQGEAGLGALAGAAELFLLHQDGLREALRALVRSGRPGEAQRGIAFLSTFVRLSDMLSEWAEELAPEVLERADEDEGARSLAERARGEASERRRLHNKTTHDLRLPGGPLPSHIQALRQLAHGAPTPRHLSRQRVAHTPATWSCRRLRRTLWQLIHT
jgi:hypothetical protein